MPPAPQPAGLRPGGWSLRPPAARLRLAPRRTGSSPRLRLAAALAAAALLSLAAAGTARADTAPPDTLARTIDGVNGVASALSEAERTSRGLDTTFDEVVTDPDDRARLLATPRRYQGSLTYSGYAAIVADSAQYTAAGAGGEIAWDAPLCRFAGAGGDVQLFRDADDAGLAAAAHATACLPLPTNTPELTYRLQRSVRPSLAARPVLRPGRYSSDTGALALAALRGRNAYVSAEFLSAAVELGVTRELGGGAAGSLFHLEVDVYGVRWRQPRKGLAGGALSIDLAHSRFRTLESATVAWVAPLRVESMPVGGGLHADVALAYTGGDLADGSAAGSPMVSISTAGLDVGLRAGELHRHGGLRYERKVEPTAFDALLLDDRVSAWVTWQTRRSTATARGFAAGTSVIDAAGVGPRILTGGGSAELAYAISPTASLSVLGEVARSFFARVDAGLAAPELGVRFMAVLAAAVGSTP